MKLAVKDTMFTDQLIHDWQNLVQVFIHHALGTLLTKYTAADCRVAFYLTPVIRFLVSILNTRQFSQVKISTEKAYTFTFMITYDLDSGK